MFKQILLLILFVTLCTFNLYSRSQNNSPAAEQPGKIIVPLQINHPYEQSMMVAWVEFDELSTEARPAGTKPGSVRHGRLPGGLRVAVESNAESPRTYLVRVDTNGDGNLIDESPLLLNLDSKVTVNVTRRWANSKMA